MIDTKLSKNRSNNVTDGEGEELGQVSSLRMFIQKNLWCIFCLKSTRSERIFQKTKKQLSKELDVVNFLKLVREVKALVKHTMGNEDRTKYLKPSRIYYVNSTDNNSDVDMT